MLYVVEIPVVDRDLTEAMNRMRTWLDRERFEPSSLRFWPAPASRSLRVSFKSAAEAAAFAAEFGGSLLAAPSTDSALTEPV